MANYYLLENGTDRLLMEDGSLFLNEDSAATLERDAALTATADLSGARAVITLRSGAITGAADLTGVGVAITLRAAAFDGASALSGTGAVVVGRSGTITAGAELTGDGENGQTSTTVERDAVVALVATLSAGGAVVTLDAATITSTVSLAAAGGMVVPVSSAIQAATTVSAEGEAVGTAAVVIEAESSIAVAAVLAGDGENGSGVIAPVVAISGGGSSQRRPRQAPQKQAKAPKKRPAPTLIASDAAIVVAVSFVPRYAKLARPVIRIDRAVYELVRIEPSLTEPPQPETIPEPPSIVQGPTLPFIMPPKPRWRSYEHEIALCLLIA